MADYRTHVITSSALGAVYGFASTVMLGFTGIQGALAGVLTGVSGMLPDLDSDSGRPIREVFGLLAAVGPLVLMERLERWGGSRESALLLAVILYVAIRYVASGILQLTCVHRGMFHSLPALVIAAEIAFLAYLNDSQAVRSLMALGVALGFGSHLVLDEIYSVTWNGGRLQLKASAGSAVKVFGPSWPVNFLVFGFALTLGYAVLLDGGFTPTSAHSPAAQSSVAQSPEAGPQAKNNVVSPPLAVPPSPSRAAGRDLSGDLDDRSSNFTEEDEIAVKPAQWQRTRR
jgi:membrane-bound metal-dependent hydrolase YbcI (DUF457 family)